MGLPGIYEVVHWFQFKATSMPMCSGTRRSQSVRKTSEFATRCVAICNAFAKKRAAAQNPWGEGATTLEWTVPSPPNFHTFEELPKFVDDQETEKSHS